MRALSLFFTFFILVGEQVNAGTDDGLYAPKAPEGSVFIRFVNVENVAADVSVNSKSYGSVPALQASSYYVFPQGNVELSFGEHQTKEEVIAGAYYTVTAVDNAFVVKDTVNDNRAKATLALYNFQDAGALSLKAKGGTVTVLENVPVGQSAARDINPVKIDLGIHIMVAGGSEYSKLAPIAIEPFIMERGNHYSVFYNGEDVFVVTASTDTTR